jgi:hypothetical protein
MGFMLEGVSFIPAPSKAALSHAKPASIGRVIPESCGAQYTEEKKETPCSTSIKLFIVLLLLTARKSQHKFHDDSEERRHLIYNYPVMYTGDDTPFQQCYMFEI